MKKFKPIWGGPEKDGISFSLLSRFLNCRRRFELYVIEGLQPEPQFNHSIEFGNMWHLCEQVWGIEKSLQLVEETLTVYCRKLCVKYPTQRDEIDKWYNVCYDQFPIYLDHYSSFSEKNVEVLETEKVFCTPYKLPSGRTVYLKGKRDKVYLVKGGKKKGVWVMEHKTKGEVDEEKITRQVTYDLQTMIYLIGLVCDANKVVNIRTSSSPFREVNVYGLKGVRYNVIRRPLSGGKGNIKQKKGSKNVRAESKADYYRRVAKYISDEPETYFFRWDIEVSNKDILRFREDCLDPILENLCDWYNEVTGEYDALYSRDSKYRTPMNWRHPFGVRNFIDEYGYQEVDHYLDTGDRTGLTEVETLFPELEAV